MNQIEYYSSDEIERAFYEASQNQNPSFVRFTLLYASFNSRISRDSKKIYDPEMIAWVKCQDSRYRIRFQRLMRENKEFRSLVRRLLNIRVINFRELKKREEAKRKGKQRNNQPEYRYLKNENDFDSLIDIIYQVRCNLFHGMKNIRAEMERELINTCYLILNELYQPDMI